MRYFKYVVLAGIINTELQKLFIRKTIKKTSLLVVM